MSSIVFRLTACRFLLGVLLYGVNSTGVEEENDLISRIQSNLTRYFAPFDMVDNTVYLYVDLYKILSVDEREGSWTVKLWMYLYYFCPSVAWDISLYGNRTTLIVPKDTFWHPDFGNLVVCIFNYHST